MVVPVVIVMNMPVLLFEGLLCVFVRVEQADRCPGVRVVVVHVVMAVRVYMEHLLMEMSMGMPGSQHKGYGPQEHSRCHQLQS